MGERSDWLRSHPITLGLLRFYSWRRLGAVLIGMGIVLRVVDYAGNRSLWLDEAAFARNVVDRSFSELLLPLDYLQTPPIGFLFLEKCAIAVLGNSEYAFRLLPLFAGISSLFLANAVAKRSIDSKAIAVFLALFSAASYLVYFSSEAKQYSFDVALALLLTLLALRILLRGMTRKRLALFAIVALTAPWLSHTAVFVTAGVASVLIVHFAHGRAWTRAFAVLGSCLPAAVSTLFAHAIAARNVTDAEQMHTYWSSGFMPMPPRSLGDALWFGRALGRIFRDPLDFPFPALAVIAFLVGVWWMFRTRRETAVLLAAPAFVVLVASAAELYPFGSRHEITGRVLLFLVPAFLFFIAEGAEQIRRRTKRGLRLAGVAFVLLLVLPVAVRTAFSVPFRREEIRPVMRYLLQHRRPGDSVYVHFGATHAWRYYARRMGVASQDFRIGICARFEPARYAGDLAPLMGHGRVWIVSSNTLGTRRINESTFLIAYLDAKGRRLDTYGQAGAAAYLYDFRDGVKPTSGYPRQLAGPEFRQPRTAAFDCRGPYAPDTVGAQGQ